MPSFFFRLAQSIWPFVPQTVRRQPIVAWVRSKIATNNGPAALAAIPSISDVRIISTLEEVDEMLKLLDQAAAISDDELRRGFTKFQMNFPLSLPSDPGSPEYRDVQMQMYEWLHGKPYSLNNETSSFDVLAAASRPFPFYTESPQTVGNHVIAIGHLIRTMNLRPGSSVLEFGPGWGNTTTFLARMGYAVTAVDIEKNFVDLINERGKQKGLKIDAIQGDFSLINEIDKQFDAILFFECFHHCSDHRALIASLDKAVRPHGKVVFAAEPITDDFPMPWGLRLDGESLWAIRKNGWLELGFQEAYFTDLLEQYGWHTTKVECAETPWGIVFVATRKPEGNRS